MRTDGRTDMAMLVVVICFKQRLSTFLSFVILLACQLPLDVSRFSKLISLAGRKTATVKFNLFWKDRIV
jgi:hypothetical protein